MNIPNEIESADHYNKVLEDIEILMDREDLSFLLGVSSVLKKYGIVFSSYEEFKSKLDITVNSLIESLAILIEKYEDIHYPIGE